MKFKNPIITEDRLADPSPSTNNLYSIAGILKWAGSKILRAADIDTDGTLAANSDAVVPSQKAVKTYVAANSGNGGLSRGKTIVLINQIFLP